MTEVRPRSRLNALLVYAVAMGWFEAVTVVYIRGLVGFVPGQPVPSNPEVARKFAEFPWLMPTEQGREAATILMLAAVAWLGGTTLRSRVGAFFVMFGVWDIVYYIGLYVLIGWPTSLVDIDLLFLIPPSPWWYQPVWLPVSISGLFILGGLWLMRSRAGTRLRSAE